MSENKYFKHLEVVEIFGKRKSGRSTHFNEMIVSKELHYEEDKTVIVVSSDIKMRDISNSLDINNKSGSKVMTTIICIHPLHRDGYRYNVRDGFSPIAVDGLLDEIKGEKVFLFIDNMSLPSSLKIANEIVSVCIVEKLHYTVTDGLFKIKMRDQLKNWAYRYNYDTYNIRSERVGKLKEGGYGLYYREYITFDRVNYELQITSIVRE